MRVVHWSDCDEKCFAFSPLNLSIFQHLVSRTIITKLQAKFAQMENIPCLNYSISSVYIFEYEEDNI